jgi:hypothetical protein
MAYTSRSSTSTPVRALMLVTFIPLTPPLCFPVSVRVSGGSIDHEVFTWLDHADSMLVFGSESYGQDTNNPACTYNELRFAQNTGKRVILLRTLLPGGGFQFPAAELLFNEAESFEVWPRGTEMPTELPNRLARRAGLAPPEVPDAAVAQAPNAPCVAAVTGTRVMQLTRTRTGGCDEVSSIGAPPACPAAAVVASGGSSRTEERRKLRQVFEFMDVDGNGQVSYNEIMRWGNVTRGRPYTAKELHYITAVWTHSLTYTCMYLCRCHGVTPLHRMC